MGKGLRKSERIAVNEKARVVYPDASGSLQQTECVILDVSEKGARLQTRAQVPHLAQVILEVNKGRTKVHGSVRYSVRGRMDWNIGVQFSSVTPVSRIVPGLAASEENATSVPRP